MFQILYLKKSDLGLGAQAGEKRLTKVLQEASFTKVRRIQEADTNIVLEVKK